MGLCWMTVEAGEGMDAGRHALGGGSCVGVAGLPHPPANIRVELGTLMTRISNGASAGLPGDDIRRFTAQAVGVFDGIPLPPPTLTGRSMAMRKPLFDGIQRLMQPAMQPAVAILSFVVLIVAIIVAFTQAPGGATASSASTPKTTWTASKTAFTPPYLDVASPEGVVELQSRLLAGPPGVFFCNSGPPNAEARGVFEVTFNTKLREEIYFASVNCHATLPSGKSLIDKYAHSLPYDPLFFVSGFGRKPQPLAFHKGESVQDFATQVSAKTLRYD